MAVLRVTGASAGGANTAGAMPLPGMVSGLSGGMPGAAGAVTGAVTPQSGPPQRMQTLTIQNGKPFVLTGTHRIIPVVGPRSVTLLWDKAASVKNQDEGAADVQKRVVFYGEIDSSYVAPFMPVKLEQQDPMFVQQSAPVLGTTGTNPSNGSGGVGSNSLGVPQSNNGLNGGMTGSSGSQSAFR